LELWFISPNCHLYTNLRGDRNHSATSFPGLNQYNYPDNGSNLLGLSPPPKKKKKFLLIFRSIMLNTALFNLMISIPLLSLIVQSQFYRRFSAGGYAVLYNDRSALNRHVDAAVDRLNVAVTHATNLAFVLDTLKSINILHCFLQN
jgi:hypothetical protein